MAVILQRTIICYVKIDKYDVYVFEVAAVGGDIILKYAYVCRYDI